MKKAFLMCALLLAIKIFGMEEPSLPHEVKHRLDNHTQELGNMLLKFNDNAECRMGWSVESVPWLPGWFIKYGIERVANRRRLQEVIEKNNIDLISVVEKYLYHVAGRPDSLSSENYLVLAKKASGKMGKGQSLGRNQVEQLWQLAIEAKHYDLHPGNYLTTEEGKVVIFDTDKLAMPSSEEVARLEADWVEHGTRIHDGAGFSMNPEVINDPSVKLELAMYSKWPNYSEEAIAFLSEKLKEREEHRLALKKSVGKD